MKTKTQAYAILRADSGISRIEDSVTVVKVVPNQELAVAETHRLNEINENKGCRYWWQTTRIEVNSNSG